MGLRVEANLFAPSTEQYAGQGQPHHSPADITRSAQRLEALGFDGVTAPEAGHDPFLPLGIAASCTARVQLGTNVAVAFPRSPMVTAQCAWDLQQYSNGRFNLGLGSQVKAHNERRYSTAWPSGRGHQKSGPIRRRRSGETAIKQQRSNSGQTAVSQWRKTVVNQ